MDETPNSDRPREPQLIPSLRALVGELGHGKAAERLGVDRKTLRRILQTGRISPRLADDVQRRLLADRRSEAERQREHLTALEGRVEGLARELQTGMEDVRGTVGSLAEELRADLAGIRDEVRRPREGGSGQDADEVAGTAAPPSVKGGPEQVIGQPAAERPWRPYPQLVTMEPAAGEELVYGRATPVIAEWREAMAALRRARRGLEQLDAERRVLELEVDLIEEHELTLPPTVHPWDRFDRRDEVWRKRQVLETIRGARRRALLLRWLRRILTLGMWWKCQHAEP